MKLERAYYVAGIGVFFLMLLSAIGVDLKKWTRMPLAPSSSSVLTVLAIVGIIITAFGLYRSYLGGYKNMVDTGHPIIDRVFRNEVVKIDGKVFQRCTFENVTFEYAAHQPFQIQNCNFVGKRIIKAATPEVEATILLLRGLGVNPIDAPLYSTGGPLPMVEPGKEGGGVPTPASPPVPKRGP